LQVEEKLFSSQDRGGFRDPQRCSIYGRRDGGTGHLGMAVRTRWPGQDRSDADPSRRFGGTARQVEDRCGASRCTIRLDAA